MRKNSKIFCLLFLLITLPKFVFAVSLFDDCAFIEYKDILDIQKNGNLLKHTTSYTEKTSYYLLIIPDVIQQCLHEKIYIEKGKKNDRGYVFVVKRTYSGSEIGTFELVKLKNTYFEFFDFETIKVILGELLQKSEKELIELCIQHSEKNGRTGKNLPLQYYLALDILSEDYKSDDATEKLKQFQIEASAHQEYVLGGSFEMNKGIRLLLKKYKMPEKKPIKVKYFGMEAPKNEFVLMKEKIDQFYDNSLNNGAVLPYAYYKLLKDVKKECYQWERMLKEAADLAIKTPDFTMGGSLEANKKIRDLLWEVISRKLDVYHLLDEMEEDEDACEEMNTIIDLLNHPFYKKYAMKLLSQNANQMFESWVGNPFVDNENGSFYNFSKFSKLVLLLLPYLDKPEQSPVSAEDYCLLVYHAIVTQNNAQIENLRKLAEDTFAKLENIGAEHFDIENLDHHKCLNILVELSPIVPEHKFTLLFYSLFYAHDDKYRSVYNFFMHIFNYVKKKPDVILGQNADENTAIRTIVNEVMREYDGDHYSDDEVHVDSNDSDEDKSDEDDVGDVNSNISDAEKSDEEKD
ncbi:MAG: hypothetical protein Q8L85_03375 [Alphaproteobacteria bacterium]|nr:hypothetical protein [Alphaproteobacteria bacterium]